MKSIVKSLCFFFTFLYSAENHDDCFYHMSLIKKHFPHSTQAIGTRLPCYFTLFFYYFSESSPTEANSLISCISSDFTTQMIAEKINYLIAQLDKVHLYRGALCVTKPIEVSQNIFDAKAHIMRLLTENNVIITDTVCEANDEHIIISYNNPGRHLYYHLFK